MKKTLLTGGAAVLALALVFSGCENSYNVTNTDTIRSLSGPSNLKAVNTEKGVITLTWERDYNVLGYEVYRQTKPEEGEEEKPAVKLLGNNNVWFSDGTNRYDDIVSDTNILKEGATYIYTVVALSANSTRQGSGEVVQSGTSTTEIALSGEEERATIPAKGDKTVVTKVTGLEAVKGKGINGNDTLVISWDKNSNPGVQYKLEVGGTLIATSPNNAFVSSIQTSKVMYTLSSLTSYTDGEKYKVMVTAFYQDQYYAAAAPAETVYTHSKQAAIISNFNASPITLSNNNNVVTGYNVSLYWNQSLNAPAGITYELYRHKGSFFDNDVEWEPVGVTIPTADATGFIQVTLSGANVPAYRQAWTFKVIAKLNGEEIDISGSNTAVLSNRPWVFPSSALPTNGTSMAVTLTPQAGKKIQIEVAQITSGLAIGDTIAFYAVPEILIDANGNITNDSYLTQYAPFATFNKAQLESGPSASRTSVNSVPTEGTYRVIAILTNGDMKGRVSLSANYSSQDQWSVTAFN